MAESPESPETVVVPYARFLECSERRRLIALALAKPPVFGDADVPPVPDQPPTVVSTTWR